MLSEHPHFTFSKISPLLLCSPKPGGPDADVPLHVFPSVRGQNGNPPPGLRAPCQVLLSPHPSGCSHASPFLPLGHTKPWPSQLSSLPGPHFLPSGHPWVLPLRWHPLTITV